MRLIKMFFLSVLATVTTAAITGASPAMAENTALCKANESPCRTANPNNLVTSLHANLTAGTVWVFLGHEPELTVLCLGVLMQAAVLGLGAPQVIHSTELIFTNCGTNASHSNCIVRTDEEPLYNLLKTGLNLGELEATNGLLLIECNTIFQFHCIYDLEGAEFHVAGAGGTNGHGMINTEATPLPLWEGGVLCPAFGEITVSLLEPLTDIFVAT